MRPDPTPGFGRRETKFLPEPALSVDAAGVFEGYASLFGVADLGRDVVVPGAFAASLAQRGPAGVRMLWQHDPGQPIGRWLSLREDGRGLHVRGRLNLAVARAQEAAALMRAGDIDGLSIGFRTVEAKRDRSSGLRRLIRLDLWEISVVTFPMQPDARIGRAETASATNRSSTALAGAIRRAARRLLSTPATRTR